MKKDIRYEICGTDGVVTGYFLDGRLYDYRTSTCIGFLGTNSEVRDEHQLLGHIENDVFIKVDGTTFKIQQNK